MKSSLKITSTLLVLCVCCAVDASARPYPSPTSTRRYVRPPLRAGRFVFPAEGGAWQISYPTGWNVQKDASRPNTWIFISADDRTRLILTRGELKAKGDEDLEEKGLAVGKRLAAAMSQGARAPARFTDFVNYTCHGFYYTLEARSPKPGDFPYVTGLSAVKDGYQLTGYFQSKDPPAQSGLVILNMIRSISYGDPPR